MDNSSLLRKLYTQSSPEILFSDVDGTLFSPNLNLLTAPLFNLQTAAFLSKKSIPFVIVTGRSFWRRTDQYHLKLLGVPKPDAVITANGTIIYYLTRNGYASDFMWQGIMQSTKVTNAKGQIYSWNKSDITDTIEAYLKDQKILFSFGQGNTYLIRIRLNKFPVERLEKIRKELLLLFPKGIRIVPTEKLLWENSLHIFSGELLVTPSTAGKDKSVQYVLKNLFMEVQKPSHAFLFGDATVDIPMLSMKQDERYYTLSQFGVHPTPLAKQTLLEKMKVNNHLHILSGDGPQEILWTLRPELRKQQGIQMREPSPFQVPKNIKKINLSAAQNNNARKVIRLFEGFLDRIVDKNLSPNEISFLGLTKLSEGLTLLHKEKTSLREKTKGLYNYGFGNLTDILDGIRARNSDKKEDNGQLVDGFADRAKEFMQLFSRAKRRMRYDENLALQTFLAALSCTLPSIARAQVEISGKTVRERDEKGGSMIDRTRRLFTSLLFETLGLEDQSVAKDLEIYTTNIDTFQNRITQAKKFDASKIKQESLSEFERKALERFLLYVDILQQENAITIKCLSKHPNLLRYYKKESQKLTKDYIDLDVNKLRKKIKIKDYGLEIKRYLV